MGSENLLYFVKNTFKVRENRDLYYCDIFGYTRSFYSEDYQYLEFLSRF
jgi:hypothetical protein